MTRRTALAALITATVLVLFAGCSGGSSERVSDGPTGQPPTGLAPAVTAALDAAVAEVDASRKELLEGPGRVVMVATGLDAVDEAAAAGDDRRAAAGRRAVDLEGARSAVSAAPQQVTAYEQALVQLEQAATALDDAQRQALAAVVTAGQDEADTTAAFATVAGAALPAYTALDQAQATWVQRSSAGWYRNEAEASAAYAVLLGPQRAPLAVARSGLRTADAARRSAVERQRAALAAADASLAPLRLTG